MVISITYVVVGVVVVVNDNVDRNVCFIIIVVVVVDYYRAHLTIWIIMETNAKADVFHTYSYKNKQIMFLD